MRKKKSDGQDQPTRPSQRPADTSPEPLSADLTTAEILAQTPPAKPRKPRKRDTAKSLGVFDADGDILDQYLYEVSQTPLLSAQQEVAIARQGARGRRGGDAGAGEAQPPLRHLGRQEIPEPRAWPSPT